MALTRLGPFTRWEAPPPLAVTFLDSAGAPINLTGFEVIASWVLRGSTDSEEFVCSFQTNGSDGVVLVPWGTTTPSPFANTGRVFLEVWAGNGVISHASEKFFFQVRKPVADMVVLPIDPDELTPPTGALTAHMTDPTDAHDASAISVVPFGSIAATDVQAALAEVLAEAGGGGGALLAANNLSDVASASTSLSNLGGATAGHNHTGVYQPVDADLTALAAAGNSAVLAATTASFLTADESKLDRTYYDVMSYGATGDGTTDDITAINAAITACPAGGVVFFPVPSGGSYKISTPILAKENVTLRGTHAPRWSYQGGSPNVIKGTAGFTGVALIHVTGDIDGGRIEHLALDGGLVSGTCDGIRLTGLCRDWQFEDVDITTMQGDGFVAGISGTFPRGLRLNRVSVYNCDDDGFVLLNTTDSILVDCLAVSNVGDGFSIENCYESSFTDCRAVFNGANGFYLRGDGTSAASDSMGQTTLNNPSTDRNAKCGILMAQEGLGPVQIVAPRLRRDGSDTSVANDSCGLKILGTSGADDATDVDVIGGQTSVGVNDGGAGNESPLFGVRVTNGGRVTIHGGEWWGVTNGYASSGTNDEVIATLGTKFYNGIRASKALDAPSILVDPDLATFSVPASTTISAFGATLVDDANAAAAITTLGLDADIATLSLPASTTISAFGATLVDDASAATARTTLDVPSNAEAILDTLIDAKGDIITATAADTPARLAVGTNGHVLTADSAAATGIKWAAAGGSTSAANHMAPFPPISGYAYNMWLDGFGSTGLNLSTSRVYYIPWTAPHSFTMSGLVVNVGASTVSVNAYLGLYAVSGSTGAPTGAPLATTAEITWSTNGRKNHSFTSSYAVTAGTPYYVALTMNTATNNPNNWLYTRSLPGAGSQMVYQPHGYSTPTNLDYQGTAYNETVAYGALPTVGSPTITTGAGLPWMGYVVA